MLKVSFLSPVWLLRLSAALALPCQHSPKRWLTGLLAALLTGISTATQAEPNHHATSSSIIALPALTISQQLRPLTPDARHQPSLYAVMLAEFAADRGDIDNALAIYKSQAQLDDAAPVFERALGLSLLHEDAHTSLTFANAWQTHNPDHVPALFYVTHLALKAHEYQLAGEKLNQILQYDPNADLSQILVGIYPTETNDQADLLTILQNIDTKNNPSLLVMKAGLLLQFKQPKDALVAIDKALKKDPKSPAFLTLKADILQALGDPQAVLKFITQARKRLPQNKSLFLYQARYLLQQGNGDDAWQLLNAASNAAFLQDDEIKLLAGLVGIDIQRYVDADKLLVALTTNPTYKDQAYYYLGISAERQMRSAQAIDYFGRVMQPSLVLQARRRQIALLNSQNRYDEAIASMVKLRDSFDEFAPQSYIMQASILQASSHPAAALELLNKAQQQLPDNTDIMFAKVLLLPDTNYRAKLRLLKDLRQLAPNNIEYQLEYAQTLVNLKQDSQEVTALLTPLIHDREVGLKARQILAQQALHLNDNNQVVTLLSDNFDVVPDVISGLLLRQAYSDLGNQQEVARINKILATELDYRPPTDTTSAP